MKEQFDIKHMSTDEMLYIIDQFFESNQPKMAEAFMIDIIQYANEINDKDLELLILNELIGYYRQTSEKEELLQIIEQAISLGEKMGILDSIAYATTALNAATGYRSIGDYENSIKYYEVTKAIYDKELLADDLRMAGLFNNMSLLYEETGKYQEALDCQLQALEIARANDAGFEIAVTYANLANSCVALKDYPMARKYASASIECFRLRNFFDAHYCAALSALAMCYYHEEAYNQASRLWKEAMGIVEESLGQNAQYVRLKESYDQCMEHCISGMDLCKEYYDTFGAPMIQDKFKEYEHLIATGLVGEGSECYGYDDDISRDHDWGLGFCMWVTQDTYNQIGKDLEAAYEELPKEWKGFSKVSGLTSPKRKGVFVIDEFYKSLLGVDLHCVEDVTKYAPTVEEYAYAVSTNGMVFRDDEGSFSQIREWIQQGYSERYRFMLLARDVAKVTQNGQYNSLRMLEREDSLTADVMLGNAITASLVLQHHIFKKYTPHEKWLSRSVSDLPNGGELLSLLHNIRLQMGKGNAVNRKEHQEKIRTCTEQLGEFFARELYATGDISDIDSYLDHHVDELMQKAELSTKTNEELVDAIVKLEFEAFDKVKNEGGRAYCQNDWPTFSVMRKSQYLTWNRQMLMQYYYDFNREYQSGHNLITEKYGRMMESTAPERYEELKVHFPELSNQKKAIIEQIVGIQMEMVETFALDYPNVAGNARQLHTYEDDIVDTSYETYLRGEISTYSDKMLQLYGQYVVTYVSENRNIARETIENTAKLCGYQDIDSFNRSYLQ